MLSDFLFSINAVMPVFLVIILGYFLRSKGILDAHSVKKMNAVVFNLALPVMLFRDISEADFQNVFEWQLLVYAVVSTLAIFAAVYVYTALFVREKDSHGAFIQGCFRGNYAIIGLPLIANIMGPDYTGKGAVITTFVIPLYNILAVFVLSIKSRNSTSGQNLVKTTVINIIKNPLIIGILLGIPFSLLNIELPGFMNTTINYLAGLASPLALLAIGAVIDFKQDMGKIKLAAMASVIKLVITPAIFLGLGILLGIRGESLIILFVLYAAPTAVSSYIMADNLGNDGELAANIILLTTISSVFTYTLGIFFLKSFVFF